MHDGTSPSPRPVRQDGAPGDRAPSDRADRPAPGRHHALWWLLAAAALPWVLVATVLVSTNLAGR